MYLSKFISQSLLLPLASFLPLMGVAEKPPKAESEGQKLFAKGSQKSFKGPEKYFTGNVQVDMVFPANEIAEYSGAYVTFEPGARTAWHSHPAGQHLIMISGTGVTGTRDGTKITFTAGDTVWCPPNLDHWHGAAGAKPMKHLVITGSKNGNNVIWKEKVTDEQAAAK